MTAPELDQQKASSGNKEHSDIFVRTPQPEDHQYVDEFYRIINTAYRTDSGWTNDSKYVIEDRISKEGIKEALDDKVSQLFIAFDAATGRPVGTLRMEPAESHFDLPPYVREGFVSPYTETLPLEEQIFIGLISVDPDQQSRGIGRKLVDAGLSYARSLGRKQAVVYVLYQRPELSGWYKRLGFVDYGEKVEYPVPRRIKHPDVHFSVLRLQL